MKQYDVAFSMGFSCGGTMALRRAGLQFVSYPLDWIGSPAIVASAKMIAADFAHWFEKDDLQLVAVRGGSFQNNVYWNRRTHFGFPHDFPRFFRFEEKFDETAEKYARRVRRFLSDLDAAQTALVVYIERPINPTAADADLVEAKRILETRFPRVRFDLVYFHLPADGAAAPYAERTVADGITAVACDYKRLDHGEVSHAIRANVPSQYIAERFAVPDRRTDEERAAYAKGKKEDRRRKFGGRLNELKYRLYRKLEEELQEKGIVPRDFPLWFD